MTFFLGLMIGGANKNFLSEINCETFDSALFSSGDAFLKLVFEKIFSQIYCSSQFFHAFCFILMGFAN